MLKTLTKQEAENYELKKLNASNVWWIKLSDDEKNIAKEMLSNIFKQRNCVHKWSETTYYDDKVEICSECDLKKINK